VAERRPAGAGVTALSRTPLTAEASTIHKPLGKPGGPGLFHHKGLQLPAYIQSVAQHLRAAHGESKAIGMAVGIVRNWAAGHDGQGGKVHPDVQAAAAKAIAQWEADKAGSGKVKRSMGTATGATMDADYDTDYDQDGLGASWDGDHSDLPDVTGMKVGDFEDVAQQMPGWQGRVHGQHQTLRADAIPAGTGGRFKKLSASLAAKGAHDPDALAAWIGQKKYSKPGFKKLAMAGRKRHAASRSGPAAEYMRLYPLEDMHIMRSGDGESSGRVVEAYATVFETPAEIHDHEGHYSEVIDRAAFNRAIDHVERQRGGLSNVKVLYNHGRRIDGTASDKYSVPIGVPVMIRAEQRGLLTRTRYNDTPVAEEILESIRSGAITSQSFTGRIVRSTPPLGPGDRYRPQRGGSLPVVRRNELGLREYGPVLWPAYSGAEILGVRMSVPGDVGPDYDEFYDDPGTSSGEGPAAGDPLTRTAGDEHSARYHQHALYRLRAQEMREKIGLTW
jgi:HK97 family phage prohead protease